MSESTRQRRRPTKAFYWPRHGFYTKNAFKEWQRTERGTLQKMMVKGGYVSGDDKNVLSPASNAMLEIEQKQTVHYAGPIAGARQGMTQSCGFRVLVTSSPTLPTAKKGEFPLWEEILSAHYGDALPYFLGWLSAAYERVRLGGGPMLPALGLAGERDLGKSLAQNHLITPLLGGRVANPVRYFTGGTDFNEDLCGAEHLMIEDAERMNKEKRAMFGDMVKSHVANENASLHPKGDKAVNVRCVWAISISTNTEPQNLNLLPLLDTSMADKLMLLRVLDRPKCLPSPDDYQGFSKFGTALKKELPALLWHVLNFKLPKECRGTRSLVRCHRDAHLMGLIMEDSPVSKLLWLVREAELVNGQPRELLSHELESALRKAVPEEAARLFQHFSAGYLLREAAKSYPARVAHAGAAHGGLTRWKLSPEEPA